MKNSKFFGKGLTLSLFLLFAGACLFAQVAQPVSSVVATPVRQSIFDNLDDTQPLKITLESDFSKLIETKNEDKYQAAMMSYSGSDGQLVQKAVKIKARGRFRKKVCDFPPLKLKFYENDLEKSGLNPAFDSYKLVSHCMENDEDKQAVLREYLAYKLYNQLTPRSYEVKLVEITYVNTSAGSEPMVRYGFLIESTDELSDRLNGEEIEQYNFGLDVMEKRDRQVFAMFQYMIGNTDWKPKMMHNVKMIKSKSDGEIVMIPYDFDFSGMVNSGYARPNPDYNQVSVEQRIYLDKVKNIEELQETIRYFKKQKEEFFETVKNMEALDKKNKREVLQYLKSFFILLNDHEECVEAFEGESL